MSHLSLSQRSLTLRIAIATVVLALAACDDETERNEYENRGATCATSDADGTLQVTVEFASCLSSSCSTVSDNTCSLQLSGNQILVTSHAIIETRLEGPCTDDCRVASAQCGLASVPPGTYAVVHGDSAENIELPTTGAVLFDPSGRALCGQL